MNITELAQRCAEETEKFYRNLPNDTKYCYELFKLALEGGNSDAITSIRQIYEPQMLKKIYANTLFKYATESAEDIAHAGFVKFFEHLRGAQFANYNDVAAILKYWQMCVWTALREATKGPSTKDDSGIAEPPSDFFALWDYITKLLPDKCDQILVQNRYINKQKPAQIAKDYPECWKDSRAAAVRLYRVRLKLLTDPGLRRWWQPDD